MRDVRPRAARDCLGFSVRVDREAVAQPEDLEQPRDRAANAYDRERPVERPEALRRIEQRVGAAGVHEGDVAEVDHDLALALGYRPVELGLEDRGREEVDLAPRDNDPDVAEPMLADGEFFLLLG